MRQPEQHADAVTAVERGLETFLGELARARKAAQFYPASHPALRGAIERAHAALAALGAGSPGEPAPEVLELSVGRRGFALGDHVIGASVGGVMELAHECIVRQVGRLFFRPVATADDVSQLVHVLVAEPEGLAAAGGIGRRLAAAGVRTIWANEANLDAVLERMSQSTPPPSASGLPQDPDDRASKAGLSTADDRPADRPPAQSVEAALLALLARLERESDATAYRETLDPLRLRAMELRAAGDLQKLLPALVVLGLHAGGAGNRRTAVREMADRLLGELVDDGTLAWLVARVGSREARGERELLAGVFLRLGARALPPLLDALSATEDGQARRALSQVITLFGEQAVPELERRLGDERWFVLRNMARLLGEVGGEGSVPALARLLAHEDGRARRAALQALAKIGGPTAAAYAVRCLTSGDPELQIQAILAVGAWRERTALPALEALARGSADGPTGRKPRDIEVRRHALEALGLIGGSRAFRVLSDLLGGGGFWRRLFGRAEGDLVRIAAAEAMALLGGAEARRKLLAVAGGRRGGALTERCRELASTMPG